MPNEAESGRSRPWVTCVVLVVVAAVMAFPGLIGSEDEPEYLTAIVFAALAIVFLCGRRDANGKSEMPDDSE